tara:strand:+ start:888 stop:2177 length:1290 start_codon:yes stop_codon:yes gene_type:complete
MSGSIAAIAAYDGSGTQGYGTTDESAPEVKSVFWNEQDTDKYYVNGCSLSEVSSNKGEITTPETIVFTFDNDSDAISDLTLGIERTGKLEHDADDSNRFLPEYYMLYFIDRIEICVGNQVICTQNTAQLVKEMYDKGLYGSYKEFSLMQLAHEDKIETTADETSAQRINLNIFRMLYNNGVDSSYLMAAANNQTLQVKVYPQNLTKTEFETYTLGESGFHEDSLKANKFTFKLFANKTSMTNAERDFLRNQVLPKRTTVTQFAQLSNMPDLSGTTVAEGDKITINCDHFNIYTESLSILGMAHAGTEGLGGFDVELYLNSTSYCGQIPYYLGGGGSSSTPLTFALTNIPLMVTGAPRQFYYYKIDLAKNSKTDQNFVPLSKFDSIRVVLTAKKNITANDYQDFFNTLTVVAEGKCTALYQNGAVTFNNY